MTHATMAEEGFTKAPFSQQSGQKTGESGLQHRPDVSYELHDASFLLGPGQRYSRQQFSHLYYERLVSLRAALRTVCAQRWPNLPVCSVLELEERQQEGEGRESQGEGVFKDGGRQVVLVGTIYKHMPLKPSILDEYMRERTRRPPSTGLRKLVSADDFLLLEDEGGRVRLVGEGLRAGDFVTGIVAAFRGRENRDGEFVVEEYGLPGPPPLLPLEGCRWPLPSSAPSGPGRKKCVALVSGLAFGEAGLDPLPRQLLLDLLVGDLEEEQDARLSAAIVRLVVVGNSAISCGTEEAAAAVGGAEGSAGTFGAMNGGASGGRGNGDAEAAPLHELDMWLCQVASSVPVDIMPGELDPANYALPQQPLHPCLLPGAHQMASVLRATNPHSFCINGVSFFGVSGQNVDDLRCHLDGDDPLDLMEQLLMWRHCAPTAPDTLGCHPFKASDPFLLERRPQVFFCGNQPTFATRQMGGAPLPSGQPQPDIRLIALPEFSYSAQVVLVDLETLACQVVCLAMSSL
eukprot:TRINITY_DN5611_c0_g1_i6.p1 TRINITY_DN5611_c0_g1~~TRINITY_DN5611_c0_g1_i6.p1  ORF type:complete len:517 (+),score=95.28 TRINITY_DN5611_c0_g1_i6:122-1672(+)